MLPIRSARAQPLLALIGVLFGAWLLWSTWLLPQLPPRHGVAALAQSVGVRVVCWLLPIGIYLRRFYPSAPLRPMRLGLPKTPHHALSALAISTAAAYFVSLDVARKLGEPVLHVWQSALTNADTQLPVAAFFEELVFRGVVYAELLSLLGVNREIGYDELGARGRVWLANLSQSLVFVGLHWPWWILNEGMGASFLHKSGGVFLLSLVLGMVFVRGGSLWPCILLHWVNNLLSSLAP